MSIKPMKIGFTGTRYGMTERQKHILGEILRFEEGEFHHGDCEGADDEAHEIAVSLGFEPVIHPPSNSSKRAFNQAKRIEKPLPYLERNRAIVDRADVLIAAPYEEEEQQRGGTWSTVRYARKAGKRVVLILPNGRIS